jgi:RNA polymerase sigma-70 factor (ECF subfamily)
MTPPASRSGKSKADARADSTRARDGDVAGRVNTNASPASHKQAPEAHPAPNSVGLGPPSSGPPSRGPGTKLPSKPPPDPRRDERADPRESAWTRARALKAAREGEAEVDLELVRRAQHGDEPAFRQLVERHQRRAFAIALSLVRHEQDARDIVQDAFLRVHKSLPTFQGSSSFFTWLYRIVTNLAIDLVRRPGRNVDELEEERQRISDNPTPEQPDPIWVSKIDGADPIDVLRRKELADRMRKAIDSLPSYHKAVILMREVEGMSYEEMAEAMQVSKGTIMSRLFHARQKLQKALADCYEEENES